MVNGCHARVNHSTVIGHTELKYDSAENGVIQEFCQRSDNAKRSHSATKTTFTNTSCFGELICVTFQCHMD